PSPPGRSASSSPTPMPFPPPPADALISSGKLNARTSRASAASDRPAPDTPGMVGTPASAMMRFASILLPMARIAAAGGPMNTRPAVAHRSAESAFSARKPYPRRTAPAPVARVARGASRMRSAARYDSRLGGGPTRTASSASRTCGAAASASEKTVTLRMPMARRVLSTRRAISPRLATRTLWIRRTGASFTGVGAGREDPPAAGADLGRARRLAGWSRTRRRLAGQPRSCYQSDGDARRAPVLRRRQPAVRYEDAPRAAQSEPRHLDLRRRVAFHPALHARRRAL